jgi:uncharacterized protein YbjT (DUF2867 family)
MKAVILGATGLVGSHVLDLLLNDPAYTEVIAVSRRSFESESSKLKEILISDLGELRSKEKHLKGDVYFCSLGTTIKEAGSKENFRKVDFFAVQEFGRIARFHGAKKFLVISAKGADETSSIFYNKVKGEMEKSLKNFDMKSLVIFRPGLLVGERKDFRLGEKVAVGVTETLAKILSERMIKKFSTNVAALAQRVVAKSKESSAPKLEIVESPDV